MLAVESVRLNRTCTPEVHLMSSQPSFFGSLFDFSFSRFVTLRLVKFFYVVAMIVLALVMLFSILFSIVSPVSGVWGVWFVLGPILALLLLMIRVWLELVVVVFRIDETATEIRDLLTARPS